MKKLIIIFFLIAAPFVVFAQSAEQKVSTTDLQKQIQDLSKQIQALQQLFATLQAELGKEPEKAAPTSVSTPSASSPETTSAQPVSPPELTRILSRGSSGSDVRKLQEFLSKDKDVYPGGLITGFFGPLTEAAVKKWQEKHGIKPVGSIGPKTIIKFQEFGKGVVQGLIERGAGASGVIPPGLLNAPGIQKKIEVSATTTSIATTTVLQTVATTTPSGTIPVMPATPATPSLPAQPSSGSGSGSAATPAIPTISATPIIPVTPTVPTQAATATTTASSSAATIIAATPPVFTISSPNGGEQWTAGNTYTITWTSAGTSVSTVNIDLYKLGNLGGYNSAIAYNISNNGSVSWPVPATLATGSDYKIRVYNNLYSSNFDESNNTFSITVPVTAPSAPPIGYWKFDGSGNSEIAGSPSAVMVGNASVKATGGKFGGDLYLSGNNDYAKIPYANMFDLPNSFSIEFWFRQRSNQSFNQNLVSKGTPINNYNFNISRWLWNEYNYGPVIAGHTAANTGYWTQPSNPNQLAHNEWHHVMFTKSANYHAYYLDGNLIGSKDITATSNTEYGGPAKTPAVDIVIGNPAPDTDIDNLRIYNYALSRSEVLYNWENIPSVVTASDVTATSTPVNLSAAVSTTTLAAVSIPQVQGFTATVSGSSVNLSWQEVAAPYSLAGSPSNLFGSFNIYRGSSPDFTPSLIPSNPTNLLVQGSVLSYTNANLPAGTYYYKIALQDKNGVVGPASSAVNAIITGPPAPTNIQAVTTASSQSQPPQMLYYMTFDYTLQSTTQSFNVYRKRPTDASFVKYTYSAQMPVNPSILPLPGSDESKLYHRDPNRWQWYTTLPAPAPDTASGEYKFYVTAVDTSGVESDPSITKSLKIYAAPTISSPADGSTISSPFTITVSGDPNASNSTYGMALYKKITGDTAWSAWPAPSTSFVYSGPALTPSDNPYRLVVWSSADGSSFHRTSIFNFSTTTTSSLDLRTRNLAAISQTLNAVKEQLLKMLREL